MDITLLRTFLTNIGNGFIDKGAHQSLEQAFPTANITEVSGYPRYTSYRSSTTSVRTLAEMAGIVQQGESLPTAKNRQFLQLERFLNTDLAVFPGCVLYPRLLEFFSPVLSDLNERGIPIVFLGAGGYFYDPNKPETQQTRDYLQRLDNIALISRDRPCYDTYGDLFEYSVPGIDNAFFISDWYQPPAANQDFDVHTFDNQEEPHIQTKNTVLRACHIPFGYAMPFTPVAGELKARIIKYRNGLFDKDNLLVSDLLEDYLFLYANGQETHSSRVHACVPALVYGNKAQFYRETPRGSLFEQVVTDNISKRCVSLSEEKLEEKKAEQVGKLERAVSELV